MDRAQARELCARAVARARSLGAEAAEAIVDAEDTVEASVQKSDLDQVKLAAEVTVGLRVQRDGRMGFATTNRPGDLDSLAADALGVAAASPPDALAGLPDPQPVADQPDAIDPELSRLDAAALATLAVEHLRRVLARDGRVTIDSGSFAVERSTRAIVSSSGVDLAWQSACAGGSLFGMALQDGVPGSFSYDGDVVRQLSGLDAALDRAFARFVESCVGALNPGQGQSFRGPVLLPPQTVEEFLIQPLLAGLSAQSVRLGRSPYAGRQGEAIAAPTFSLEDAGPGLPGFALAPFDREGQPRRPRSLVEDGVLKGFLYDSREARAAGVGSTGSASGGASSQPGIGVAALRLRPGSQAADAMLAGLDKGVLVTRFSGSTNPVSGDFSGVVKGGFLVENGVKRPIHETTVAGNVWACLHQISAISRELTPLHGTRAWPWVRIDDLSITAA